MPRHNAGTSGAAVDQRPPRRSTLSRGATTIASQPCQRTRTVWLVLASAAVFLLGFAVNSTVAVRGFMPLDQSIVFDSAWRILSGQVPVRDYATPNGFIPALLQAAVLRVGGVSWASYIGHASVLNGLFAIAVLLALRAVGASLPLAMVYAGASVVIFQPPFGTPFMDQTGFFFALIAIVLALTSRDSAGRRGLLTTAAIPLALALSLLSKQVPGAIVVPLVLVLCFERARDRRRTAAVLATSTTAVIVVLAVVLAFAGVPFADFVYHVWTLPWQLGAERMRASPSPVWGFAFPQWNLLAPSAVLLGSAALVVARGVPERDRRVNRSWLGVAAMLALATAAAVVFRPPAPGLARGMADPPPAVTVLNAAGGYAVVFACLWLVVRTVRSCARSRRAWETTPTDTWLGVLPAALIVVCCAFVSVTANQIENGVPFAFLALGMVHAGFLATLDAPHFTIDPQAREAGARRARPSGVGLLVTAVFLVITMVDVVAFQRQVNNTRVVHDFVYDPEVAQSGRLPPGLELRLEGPLAYTAGELGRITRAVADTGGDVVILGDTTVIAALARVDTVSPLLWLDPGLVYPPPGTPRFDEFDHRLADALRRPETRAVVVERSANPWWHERTAAAGEAASWRSSRAWTGARPSDFPRAMQVIDGRLCSLETAGPFTLLLLCDPSR